MSEEHELTEFFKEWMHFLECIDFDKSAMTARATTFMLDGPDDIRKMYENKKPIIKEHY